MLTITLKLYIHNNTICIFQYLVLGCLNFKITQKIGNLKMQPNAAMIEFWIIAENCAKTPDTDPQLAP